jgi:Fic family protein
LEALLGTVLHQKGRLDALSVDLQAEGTLLTLDVLKSSEIEGELLPPASVRSSIAWRLGLEQAALPPADRRVEGVVAMLLDGFEGKFITAKWARMAHCSRDTAGRDMADLLAKGVLVHEGTDGRSTRYCLTPEPEAR